MPLMFRDYFARRAALGDAPTFGPALRSPVASSHAMIRTFLQRVAHPFAAKLMEELDAAPAIEIDVSVSRLDRPVLERQARARESWSSRTTGAKPSRSPNRRWSKLRRARCWWPVSRTSARRRSCGCSRSGLRPRDGAVFEAGGADLMAGQIYIGQLEGRIRDAVEELDAGKKRIWYIPDIVQLARSGTHQGQSASILDQILPAVSSGRLVIWCEATPTERRAPADDAAVAAQPDRSRRRSNRSRRRDTLTLARGVIEQTRRQGEHPIPSRLRRGRARHRAAISRERRACRALRCSCSS